MSSVRRLIVGLGNPGPKYAGTRHNIGFEVADAVAEARGIEWESTVRQSFFARLSARPPQGAHAFGEGRYRGVRFGLLKPLTFMNLSGQAVAPAIRRLGLTASDILVIVDDIHLPTGAIRIRPSGSDAGHNGMRDIAEVLNSNNFPRMRIGVGNSFGRGQQVRYVLAPFDADEQDIIAETITTASQAALTFASHGVSAAMNRFNRKASPLAEEKDDSEQAS
ncbi:MAG: aminoacyl-tRNA hydrolase [Bacteroidota bacterium]